jgi:hypothetical protein
MNSSGAGMIPWLLRAIRTVMLLCTVATVAACSSKVGVANNGNAPPTALITPVGFKPTAGAGTGSVSITVRSGSVVILSGKDSVSSAVAPTGFQFIQTGGPSLPAAPDVGAMLYQTADTVALTAPQVASSTPLTFQLKVTDALGVASTASAVVTVLPANDADEFLMPVIVDNNPAHPRRFAVAVATSNGLTAPLSGDVTVCVSVNRKLSYTSRDTTMHTGSTMLQLPQLASLQADATWTAAVGGAGAVGEAAPFTAALQSTTNPRVVFDVPALNDVELAAMFNQPSFSGGTSTGIPSSLFNQELVASDLDTAVMYLSITATPGSCDGTVAASSALSGNPIVLGVYTPGGNAPILTNGGSGTVDQYRSNPTLACSSTNPCTPLTADSLLTALKPPPAEAETLASATAYYAKLDPGATKMNLNDWLDANCFDHTQSDYGIGAAGANGAHAIYTNNYDLGFGRDMYFIKCAADHTNANGIVTAHAGDMASVVINYPSLEQTALTQSPIIAVAMEYQGEGHTAGNCGNAKTSTCFTKFYIFAPDDRTGLFQRVSSANFDRRGEKYLPGACLSCHGGAVTDTTFSATANVDAAFIPWDLDALLYSDTDPAFKGNLIGPNPYTRVAQEPNLKKLNALAWQTYQTPELLPLSTGDCASPPVATETCVDRFAAPIALLRKWYGANGPNDASAKYDDSCTPGICAAAAGAVSANWPTAPAAAPNDLYHLVYAHHCRSCHTSSNSISKQFNDFDTFQSTYLKPGTTIKSLQQLVFKDAQMPLARLTMDRFWSDFDGGTTSAAQTLATYINDLSGATPVATDAGQVVPSGAPVLNASVYPNVNSNGVLMSVAPTGDIYTVARFTGSRADFSSNLFASEYQSTLCLQQTVNPTDACIPQLLFVGANNAMPAFDTSASGYYKLTLTATSDNGLKSTLPLLINAPLSAPNISCSNQVTASVPTGVLTTVISLANCTSPGDTALLQIQDPTTGTWLPTPSPPKTLPPANMNLNASVSGADYTANLVCTSAGITGCSINVLFGLSASYSAAHPLTLNYRLLDQYDNLTSPSGTPPAQAALSVLRAYTANTRSYPMTLAPNVGQLPTATTLCIPLASGALSGAAVCNNPPSGILGLLDAEIVPADDQFKLTLAAPAPGGSVLPAPNTATDTNLQGGLAVSYTTPNAAFLGLSGSFVTCDVNGNEINWTSLPAPCLGVTIAYTLQSDSVSGTQSCASPSAGFLCNTFTVLVNATTSFSQSRAATSQVPGVVSIYSILSDTTRCASCHVEPSPATAPASCTTTPAQATCKWWVVADVSNTPRVNAAGTLAILNSTNTTTGTNCASGSTNCISPGNPVSSQLYLNVCSSTPVNGHGPVQPSTPVTDQQLTQSECNTLSQWIAEGANLN